MCHQQSKVCNMRYQRAPSTSTSNCSLKRASFSHFLIRSYSRSDCMFTGMVEMNQLTKHQLSRCKLCELNYDRFSRCRLCER